jgi:AraC-like DNA-binding protein
MQTNALKQPAKLEWRLAEIPVKTALQSYVGTYYYLHLPKPDSPLLRRVITMATPSLDLLLNLGDPFVIETFGDAFKVDPGVWLAGPRPATAFIRRDGELHLLGARFKHGTVSSLLPYPVKELEQRLVPLAGVWSETHQALSAALAGQKNPADLVKALDAALTQLLTQARKPDPMIRKAVKLIAQHAGDLEVSAMAAELGVSRQTVKHKFDQHVGVSPKLYGKLRRFQVVLRRLASLQKVDWTRLAQESGYYDQAHLIREFNHFTGFSPQKFLKNLEKGDDLYLFDSADQTHFHAAQRQGA